MLTIYKNIKDIPNNMEYIELNDIFFNQNTVLKLDEKAETIMAQLEDVKQVSQFKIASKFNDVILDIDCLSSGCKTVLNIVYFPNKVFSIKECGDNAIELLYQLNQGAVYSDYAVIPFDMEQVMVSSKEQRKIIDNYDELKEWWDNEE